MSTSKGCPTLQPTLTLTLNRSLRLLSEVDRAKAAQQDAEKRARQLEQERVSLQSQIEELRQAARRPGQDIDPAEVARLRSENERLGAQLRDAQSLAARSRTSSVARQPATTDDGVRKLVVTTSAEASPAVVRMVELALADAERVVHEAESEAGRKVQAAETKAHELTVDALVVANRASDSAVTIDVVAAHSVNLEDGLAVVDEDDVAGLAVLGQTLESGGDALLIAHNVVSGDSELATNLEVDLAVRLSFGLLEQAGTDLRALEVGQGCHVETKLFRDRANQVKTLLVLGVVAVAHVETGNIHASLHELLHGVMAGHSGPKGIHNLSSTHAYTIPLKATRARAGMPVTVGCTLDVHL
jgi:vacuolar-type H+-ATPase subunit H